ncbi:hypothetical protein ABOZ73_03165 [Caulobacter sp. 73W]|uniref:Energy transducer TonB n=1 Tax=Caulobacter sp. 73W TaxID=3161137 RepID=A0AB39KUW6_9CAUL
MPRPPQIPSREPPSRETPPRKVRKGRLPAAVVSLVGHGLVLTALLWSLPDPPDMTEPPSVLVEMILPPPPQDPADAPAGGGSAGSPAADAPITPEPPRPETPPSPPLPRQTTRPRPPIPEVEPLPASAPVSRPSAIVLGPAALAGAKTAGTGVGSGTGSGSGAGAGSGDGCNMVRLLQDALRRNAKVRAAVASAHSGVGGGGGDRALLVWNGDWVRNGVQDGKGLAGVRQAIALEVAFAPEPCRREPVRGLVLISLNDAPGSVGLALGQSSWRWSDLLFAEGSRRGG